MIGAILGVFGVFTLAWRLRRRGDKSYRRLETKDKKVEPPKSLSVIIPARNEAHNLPRLLSSLSSVKLYASFLKQLEVIVIDDHSHDNTAQLAKDWGAKVIPAEPLSSGWGGKNWACHQGAKAATGEYLLFIDADTELDAEGVFQLLDYAHQKELSLVCPQPYHLCDLWWEKFMGAFHALYLVATAISDKPTSRRLYANGQCLLFSREYYLSSGGHEAVKNELAEDIALAKHCIKTGGRYEVYRERQVYRVNMYANFSEFIAGWRRIFRLGIKQSSKRATLEVTSVVVAFLGAGELYFSSFGLKLILVSALILAYQQRRFGHFHFLGAFLSPLAALLFSAITFLGLFDRFVRRPVLWKNRQYQN